MVDGVPTISTDRTYADDGERLYKLWLTSLFFLVGQCILGCYASAPPTRDNLRKWGINLNDELNEEGQAIVRASL